jgi:cell wall-associated NlpC family hydrolase
LTNSNLPHASRRPIHRLLGSRRRRLLAGVAATIASIATVGGATGSASAARIGGDHHSVVVVERANAALAAHDAFSTTGTPGSFVAYLAARDATADAVAVEMQLDPAAVRAAWAKADTQHQEAVLAALGQLGKPYRHATSDPAVGFDCSGLTAFAWGRAGLDIPNQSSSQINAAGRRDAASAVAGDLVQYPGHVSMWLGVGDAVVHAANPQNDVELSLNSRSVRYGDPQG